MLPHYAAQVKFNHGLLVHLVDYSAFHRKKKPSSSLSETRRRSLPLKSRMPCEDTTLFSKPSWHSYSAKFHCIGW